MAKRKRKTEFAGAGCLVQGLGLLVVWIWPIGTLIGVALLWMGSRMALYYICGGCGNRLTDKAATICAACKEPITR